jgi:hypothetical protein
MHGQCGVAAIAMHRGANRLIQVNLARLVWNSLILGQFGRAS